MHTSSQQNPRIHVFIPGAGRSGTTTLYSHLAQHPEICFSSIKELHYFTQDDLYARGPGYPASFYPPDCPGKWFAMADTYAMADARAAKRAAAHNPAMKLVFMLRDPVDRALSGYRYAVNMGYLRRPDNWHEILHKEPLWLQTENAIAINNLCNAYQGLYYKHLQNWLQYFPRKQVLLLKTSDLQNHPATVLEQLSIFLAIPPFQAHNLHNRANAGKSVKNKFLQQALLNRQMPLRKASRKLLPQGLKNLIFRSGIIDRLHRMNAKKAEDIQFPDSFKNALEEYFKEDKKQLHSRLGIDL